MHHIHFSKPVMFTVWTVANMKKKIQCTGCCLKILTTLQQHTAMPWTHDVYNLKKKKNIFMHLLCVSSFGIGGKKTDCAF